MDEIIYYNSLYDIYESLLTDKQRKYFEDYYFHNLSYAEMSEKYHISRNAAFRQVHIVVNKLLEYEEKLKLYEKRMRLLEISKKISDKKIQEQLESFL